MVSIDGNILVLAWPTEYQCDLNEVTYHIWALVFGNGVGPVDMEDYFFQISFYLSRLLNFMISKILYLSKNFPERI